MEDRAPCRNNLPACPSTWTMLDKKLTRMRSGLAPSRRLVQTSEPGRPPPSRPGEQPDERNLSSRPAPASTIPRRDVSPPRPSARGWTEVRG
jgi:hypothetical protein